MFRPLTIGLGLVLALLSSNSGKKKQPGKFVPPPQGLLKCEDAKVRYSPPDEAYSKRIILKSVTDSENPPESAHKEYSPDRNMWMAAIEPDTSKPGPWDSSFFFGSDDTEEVWKLTFVDRRDAAIKWLNEKLVFGQVSWGRIYATEFVLDIQQHKFLYREMANYGAMTEPCQ